MSRAGAQFSRDTSIFDKSSLSLAAPAPDFPPISPPNQPHFPARRHRCVLSAIFAISLLAAPRCPVF